MRLLMPMALALLAAAAPAAAQEATQTAPAEPLPLFDAVCVSGGARLSRKTAEPASYAALPPAAQRALGASTVATRAEAEKLPAPAAALVDNTIYRIGGGQVYLFVPSTAETTSAIGQSCIVLWYALSDEDYGAARKIVLPGETGIPMTARPTASAVGASVATATTESTRLTAAAYGGWVALRSQPLSTPSKAPGAQ